MNCFSSTAFWVATALLMGGIEAYGEQPCSTEKVNGDCTFTVDRVNPLQPPTLQMRRGATITVQIQHAIPFEQVSLDWTSSTGSLTPDPSSSIVNTLSANLQKFVAAVAVAPPPGAVRPPGVVPVPSVDQCAQLSEQNAVACTTQMIIDAQLAVTDIGSLANDDTLVYNPVTRSPIARTLADYNSARTRILCRILGPDLPSTAVDLSNNKITCGAQYHDLVGEQQALTSLVSSPSAPITEGLIPALVNYTGTLVPPLEVIAQNLLQLNAAQGADGVLGTIVDPSRSKNASVPSCNSSLSAAPNPTVYEKILQRGVTCAVNVINLVANSTGTVPTASLKRTVMTISVNYAESRIETSTGVMVSALPSRSFAATSIYSGTPPTVTNTVVQERDAYPLIVPYAAVDVRLGNDWLWLGNRRGAFYGTFLIGVNPNTTTADFGVGVSVSWRSLMLSPLVHFAHDVRLTQGFTNGESLGTSFAGSLPTQQVWTTTFGVGIGIRLPLITGR